MNLLSQRSFPGFSPSSPSSYLLISIRPEHADRIFSGSKRYELRKQFPRDGFSRIYLYATDRGGIVGYIVPGEIIELGTNALWDVVGPAATTRERFFEYFNGHRSGIAIKVAESQRFNHPLALETLRVTVPGFAVPQSYSFVRPGTALYDLLSSCSATGQSSTPRVSLRPISAEAESVYRALVTAEVGARYDEITESFADRNLVSARRGSDPNGFLTVRKEVLSILAEDGHLVGFTTLTHKMGGCVKTGPTVVVPCERRKGYGFATRIAIVDHARAVSARKLYCTCPDNSDAVIRYLMRSGLRIEAHLREHYSRAHGEIVFGQFLDEERYISAPAPCRSHARPARVVPVDDVPARNLRRSIRRLFSAMWFPVPEAFARMVVDDARSRRRESYEMKPKLLVPALSARDIVAAVVLLPKRGGSMKGLLLSSTAHGPSISRILERAESTALEWKRRKLYFLHPLLDAPIVGLLLDAGYRAEGLLRAPYRAGQDVLVLSKFF